MRANDPVRCRVAHHDVCRRGRGIEHWPGKRWPGVKFNLFLDIGLSCNIQCKRA